MTCSNGFRFPRSLQLWQIGFRWRIGRTTALLTGAHAQVESSCKILKIGKFRIHAGRKLISDRSGTSRLKVSILYSGSSYLHAICMSFQTGRRMTVTCLTKTMALKPRIFGRYVSVLDAYLTCLPGISYWPLSRLVGRQEWFTCKIPISFFTAGEVLHTYQHNILLENKTHRT